MDAVSVDDDVLAEVSPAGEALDVGWGWLVHRPVVEWGVVLWVLGVHLSELLLVLLMEVDLIGADQDVESEVGFTFSVSQDDWVDVDWDALAQGLG